MRGRCWRRWGKGDEQVNTLVLSLFPGIGLFDMAFELEGFCVVRGPDLLWGGDIRRFHPPAGKFDGVIGGPPCQPFSQLVHMIRHNGYEPRHENLIPEFERVVSEARPTWFLMEEVPAAPIPKVEGYLVRNYIVNNRWVGGTQERKRRITFGSYLAGIGELPIEWVALEPAEWDFAVTGDARRRPVAMLAGGKRKSATNSLNRGGGSLDLETMCRLQGLPETFLADAPFTVSAKRQAIGNGVPLPMGRAIAKAVRALLAALGEGR